MKSNIEIKTSNFKGEYETNLRAEDFQNFLEKLTNFKKKKKAEFVTMEGGLYLKCSLTKTGTINWEIKASTDFDFESLSFHMEIDSGSIENLIEQLKKILSVHPVKGGST